MTTIDSIQRILYYELSFLEKKKEFKDAIKIIEDLQKEVLIPIEQKIKKTLQEFLPNIKDVQISKSSISRRMFFSLNPNTNIEIMVDDGNLTSIEYKGDGVKSLASLAMLKDRFLKNTASIIAIEEPEAHLHPEAIHQLIETINSLSVNNQIIITTHNPLFIQRNNLKSNVIIKQSIAKPAKDIKEIRETLGVLPEDNLINASFVLVVEGLDDKIILMKLLPIMSSKLKKALMSNFLVLENIDGAGNLSSKLTALRNNMCKYFVFLDNDDAGLEAAKKAKDKGLLLDSEVKYTIVNGSPQAELEDCLNPDFYRNQIKSTYKVNLDKSEFKTNKKWSERMKKTFYANGQDWNDKIETNVKMIIAECTPNDPKKALISQKCSSIDSLIKALESLLKV